MKFYPILMDLIPVDPIIEEEAVEKGPEVSAILLVAAAVFAAAGLIFYAVRKNKK